MSSKRLDFRPRKPQLSPLWKCLCRHFYDFVQAYPETYEKKYGFLKPAVEEVVDKYLDCGDLSKGFARLHRNQSYRTIYVSHSLMVTLITTRPLLDNGWAVPVNRLEIPISLMPRL